MAQAGVDLPEAQELKLAQLSEQAYDLLKSAIIAGTLHPGQKLSVPGLAKQLGVSATPIRDALRRLNLEGLVDVSPRSGTYVSDFTRSNVQETYRIRRIIECAAAAEAASVSAEAIARLQSIVDAFARLRNGEAFSDYQQYIALDTQFHQTIVGTLASPKLNEFYDRLRWPEQLIKGLARSTYQRAELTVAEHRRIAAAFASRDAAEAAEAIRTHLANAEADLLRRMPLGH